MALRTPWDSTVEDVQRASTLRPEAPARTPFSPMVERLAPTPNDPRFHGDGRYGGTPNPPNPTPPQPAAATPSPAAAAAEAPAAEAAKKGGWFRRAASAAGEAANTLRNAPGKAVGMLDADIMPALRAAPGKVASMANSTLGRAALPVSVGMSAMGSADTSTAEYERRTGLRGGDVPSDLGVRAAGVIQDLGNNLTFGVADRVGNLITGNGFKRSAGNQVGELFGPGQEVGGPAALPNAPQAAGQVSADPRTATDWAPRPDVSAPAGPVGGTVNRVGNSFSGEDVKAGFGYTGAGRPAGLTPAQGGGGLRGGGTVTSLNMSEGHRQNLLELARLRDPNSSGAFVNGQFVQSPDSQLAAQRASVSTGDGGNTLGQGAVGFGPGGGGGLSGRRAERANAMAISAANNETQRLNNERTNQTTLRGQEMLYAGHMAPLQYQQGRMQLAGQYLRAAGGDPAKAFALASSRGDTDIAEHLGKTVSTMQGQAAEGNKLVDAKYDEVKTGMKGRFNFMDKEGQPKMSDAMEAQAYTRFRNAHPDFHNEPDQAKRQQMLRDHLGDEELAARFGAPKNGGYANLVPGFLSPNQPMLRQNGIPGDDLLVKGKIDTPYKGALLSPGIQSGDRFYDPGPGKSAVNMGDLSADALQRLNFHMQSAKQREANRLRN